MAENTGGRRLTSWMRGGGALTAALLLAGCYEGHLARRDTISIHAGDAVATNIILQTADPWPPTVWDKSIAHDGTRMVNAIDTYHDPGTSQTSPGDSVTSGLTTD